MVADHGASSARVSPTQHVQPVPWREEWSASSADNGALQIMVRPDCVDMEPDEAGNAVVAQRDFLGGFNIYTVALDTGHRVQMMQSHVVFFEPGSRVQVFMREGHSPLAFVDGRALGGAGEHRYW